MALIDDLKTMRGVVHENWRSHQSMAYTWQERADEALTKLGEIDIAIAALEAPAQPVHPDELRSVPGAEEEVRDHLIDAQTCEAVDPHCSWKAVPHPDPTDIHGLDEATAKPFTDLWQQGYNDKLNGFEPSLAEPEYTKGYEARALIEREHSETMERAKFFEGGMMADADRHQSDQRSIVEKIGGVLGFKQKADA